MIRRAELRAGAYFGVAVVLLLAVAAVLAVQLRFVQDDAFISYRYAENLVLGHGLVWEPGLAVQGYTNLLWTLLLATGMALGGDPVAVSYVLGIGCFLVTLTLLMSLLRRTTNAPVALGCGLFLIVNFTFVIYATGGVETSLQTMLLTAALWQTQRILAGSAFRPGPLVALSALFALAGLTRLDSALFIAGLSTVVLLAAWRQAREMAAVARAAAALVLPGFVVFAGYMAFSLGYYGDPLPNTFAAKSGEVSATAVLVGVRYVSIFVLQYGFVLPAIFVVSQIRTVGRDLLAAGVLGVTLVWLAYLVVNGGDFMEFRLMVPILPFVTFLVGKARVALAARLSAGQAAGLAVIGLIAIASMSASHAVTFIHAGGVESRRALLSHLYAPGRDWVGIGQRLREVFPGGYEDGPHLAVGPAGAIPFHSRLRSLDILGLNVPWVARHGIVVSNRPGHKLRAPLDYILEREVHLLISHPHMVDRTEKAERTFCPEDFDVIEAQLSPDAVEALRDASVIRLPINERFDLAMIYLREHPAVEAALHAGSVREVQRDLVSPCGDGPVLADWVE